jgi:hypothetical protein
MLTKTETNNWDAYPTYEAYVAMMQQFAADYPELCRLVVAGQSVDGRDILFAKLSANVDSEEAEPEVQLSSSMHGDEIAGYVLMLRLIDTLLTGYGTDGRLTAILDNVELHINPLANPDGTYGDDNSTVATATRRNANGVDLNRNFPDFDDGPNPDGNVWQPETLAMIAYAEAHSFVLSANFHGGAEVINYPWDTISARHADDTWFVAISRAWADSAQAASPAGYMSGFDDGITNGYDWYPVAGGRQDFLTYYHGGRELTVELSDTDIIPANQLPAHWDYHAEALLAFIEAATFGISGAVTDSDSGLGVAATITVVGHDTARSVTYTDPDVGDYHRMIEPGTYTLTFTAEGYEPRTISDIAISEDGAGPAVTVDVIMTPLATTVEPTPTITANDATDAVVVDALTPLTVRIALDPGDFSGERADWWVLASTPSGYYWYTPAGGWQASATAVPAYVGKLDSLAPLTVLDYTGLPSGEYTFYFAVDEPDGRLNVRYWDGVTVTRP